VAPHLRAGAVVARDREPRPGGDEGPPLAEGELHRLWSPEQLHELADSKRRYSVGRRLSQLAADVMSKRITDETIVRRLRQLADIFEGSKPKKRKPRPAANEADIQTVFAHWVEVSGHKRAQLDERRRRMIAARLEFFTVEELCLVIDYAHEDDFWGGAENRKGVPIPIEGYMKSHALVEDLLRKAHNEGFQRKVPGSTAFDESIEALEERAAALVREGRIDEANRLGQDIRRRLQERAANT